MQCAAVGSELSEPRYQANAWDCEDQSFRLRQRMAELNPHLNVSAVFNYGGDYTWDIF